MTTLEFTEAKEIKAELDTVDYMIGQLDALPEEEYALRMTAHFIDAKEATLELTEGGTNDFKTYLLGRKTTLQAAFAAL